MDLIQENGQPRYGRFEALPTAISMSKYVYKTPFGKELKSWRKKLKYKKFKFCSIQHEQYSIGLAIVDLTWAGHAFFYVQDASLSDDAKVMSYPSHGGDNQKWAISSNGRNGYRIHPN